MAKVNLTPWLSCRADQSPDEVALDFEGATYRYRDLLDRSRMLARRLHDHRLRPGERVAVLLPSRLLLVDLIHAAEAYGLVLVLLNTRLTVSELVFQIEDSGAGVLIHDEREFGTFEEQLSQEIPGLRFLSAAQLEWAESEPLSTAIAERRIDPEAVRVILYTSGTSGRPKGVPLSSRNFRASAEGSKALLGGEELSRWLLCLPVFHVGGLSVLLRAVLAGTTVLLHDRFDSALLNRAIDEENVSGISLVATMLQRLLDAREDRPAPSSLRCVLLGGGPAAMSLVARAEAAGFPITPTYGLTEAASQVATRPRGPFAGPPASGLLPLPGIEIRILGEDGAVLSEGREGEISIRGPSVMTGYWSAEEKRAVPLEDGWLDTGDIGSLASDGRLRVFDRRSDLIVSGGENIYPAEIESILLEYPSVAEAAVAGAADPGFGERPVAWVVLEDGADFDEAALRRHCQTHLARYKLPSAIHLVEALPRNALGKLLRRKLGSPL